MIAYMAGPIDYAQNKGVNWKNELIELCQENENILLYDPFGPFKFSNVTVEFSRYIHNVNLKALKAADCVVAKLMKGQSSVGTPIELYYTINQMPLIIWTDMEKSVYMKYITEKAIMVNNINHMYNEMIKTSRTFINKDKILPKLVVERV